MAHLFNTLVYANKLKEAGFSDKQAAVQAETLTEIADQLVTKTDFTSGLKDLEYRLTIKLGGMLVLALSILTAIMKL
jgi:hypothetical protein